MSLPLHGSNINALYNAFHIDMPNNTIDFSANINPLGTLQSMKDSWSDWFTLIEDYPDPDGIKLKQLIVQAESISEEQILLGNGAAELITLLANYLRKKRIAIVQPTFVEYEKMCTAFQCEIEHIILQENAWEDLSAVFQMIKKVDAIFICNPNNPTGVRYNDEQLLELITQCEEEECLLIIDEAFYDFAPTYESYAKFTVDYEYVVVLRSLTKMYSIAGLRLGYALASSQVIQKLKEIQPYWNVNALALEAGLHCIQNESFAAKTRSYIKEERIRLQQKLRMLGYVVSNSIVNYLLVRDEHLDKQTDLIRYLLKEGIVPRHTENFRGLNGRWLRFAVKRKDENEQLIQTLTKWWKRT